MDEKPHWMIDHEQADLFAFSGLNQKLDALAKQQDLHMQKLEPYLQGAAGLGIIWKSLVAVGGIVIVWMQIKRGLW